MIVKNLQKFLLFGLGIPIVILTIIVEYYDLIDSCLYLYGFILLCGSIILGHWIYWWRKAKEKTTIFLVNGFLIASILLTVTIQFIFRLQFVFNKERYINWLASDWWAYRISPEAIIFFWLLTWIVSRMYGSLPEKKFQLNEKVLEEEKLNVLVIDDNKQFLEIMDAHLRSLGKYNIYLADNCEDGLILFKERKYFLIFLDLKFKGSFNNSLEFAKNCRDIDKFVWITILTGYIFNAQNQELLEYVDDIVSKPISFTDLKSHLILWNLKFRRRMSFIKSWEERLDCYNEKIEDMYFILSKQKKKDSVC